MGAADREVHAVEVMGETPAMERFSEFCPALVLLRVPNPSSVFRVSSVWSGVNESANWNPENTGAEIHQLGAIAVDAVAGARCGRAVARNACVREVEAVDGRAVSAEDLQALGTVCSIAASAPSWSPNCTLPKPPLK